MKIGFLGTGHITSSVIEGIFKSKLNIKKIYISPRNRLVSKKLSKKFKKVTISKSNQQLLDACNWVFLAVTPNVGHKILKKLNFKRNQKIISFISTINLKQLKEYTKSKNITRVIPMPFIGIKKGNEDLLRWVNVFILHKKLGGDLNKISLKWLGQDLPSLPSL